MSIIIYGVVKNKFVIFFKILFIIFCISIFFCIFAAEFGFILHLRLL